MYRVGYYRTARDDYYHKDFVAFASAQFYFLQKLHEGKCPVRLSFLSDDPLEVLDEQEEGVVDE